MIGFAAAAAGRGAGGIPRHVDGLARALLAESARRGRPFRLVGGRPPGRTPCAKYATCRKLARAPVELLHVPNTYAPWQETPFAKAVTVHDLTPLLFPWGHTWRNVLYHRLMLARVLAAADHVFAASRATRRDLVRSGVPAERITVSYGAADPVFFTDGPRDPARPGMHLLFVGANEPRKNLPGLLAAYRILRTVHGVRLPLRIAGPAGWKTRIPAAEPGVEWLGFVPDADLARLYREAAIFVYPSFYEGFGLPVVEAMAAGTPVVTSDRGAIPEVAGRAALYADPARPGEIAQACARLLVDRALWDQVSRHGMARARLFSWEKTACETWDVYEEILGGRGSGARGPRRILSDPSPLTPHPSDSVAACG